MESRHNRDRTMAESNIVKGNESKGNDSTKAVLFYDAKEYRIVSCPKDVLAFMHAYVTAGRDGDWKWEELAIGVLASSNCGMKGHARLDECANHAGRALRGCYQSRDNWLSAFGASNTIPQFVADAMYNTLRFEAWHTIAMRPVAAATSKGKGKSSKAKPALPTLA